MGPVAVGTQTFILQTSVIDHSKIPNQDILGVTVVLLTCSYLEKEFVRIGYYVRNEYSEEFDPENPPDPVDVSKIARSILDDQPRVTYFTIPWGVGPQEDMLPPSQDESADGKNDDNMDNGESGEDANDDDDEGEEEDDEGEEEDSTGDMEIDINEDSMDVAGMQNGALAAQ